MTPLTYEENKSNKQQKVCHICKNTDKNDKDACKLYHRVSHYCHYTGNYRRATHNIYNIKYKIPKEILEVFHEGSTYNSHFIIKELAKEFEGQFECLG